MGFYSEIKGCRLSKDAHLETILNLGMQSLTGVFPKPDEAVPESPLELVWNPTSGVLQLKHSYSLGDMYGDNYGYRSGLNQSMVDHLINKVRYLKRNYPVTDGDVVLDIGSNDCTLLKAYNDTNLVRIGIDPTGNKFSEFYPESIQLVPDFFSAKNFNNVSTKKAKIVTSIAMFYDLEDPIQFAKEVESILDDGGIWHLEQSYMPSMLRMNSYDTICHEHLEYYSLSSIKKIMDAADLKIVDVIMNNINGGSFAVTVCKKANKSIVANDPVIQWLLGQEDRMSLHTLTPYHNFEERVYRHREDLTRLIRVLNADGKKVFGYGASTKGNVVLQFCGLTSKDIPVIADVNPDKFGRVTPGTNIPIVSEEEARSMKPDYFLVLPWHFKDGILRREKDYLASGGKFIFPFPEIEII